MALKRKTFAGIRRNFQNLWMMTNTGVGSSTEARANFQELINRAEYKGERIIIQRHGKAAVAIISLDDLKLLEAIEDAIDSETLRRAIEENNGFTSLEAISAKRGNE